MVIISGMFCGLNVCACTWLVSVVLCCFRFPMDNFDNMIITEINFLLFFV